ncbi:cytochrome b561 [Rhizobium etli]|uniref:Cytochrome b561 n=1 Tax=Rhizobium etli TaxID=29449 RepID=A0A7W7EGE3_RHIET|nr:cytochrome b561 [Rhizobium etli]MBB4538098.1 cytochrome b561 [Rhizobium etli]
MKRGYTPAQIGLHWLIALMIPVQYLTGGSIERTHHAVHMGVTSSSTSSTTSQELRSAC